MMATPQKSRMVGTPEKSRVGSCAATGAYATSTSCVGGCVDEVMAESSDKIQQWRKEKVHAFHADAKRALQDLHVERAAIDNCHSTMRVSKELTEAACELQAAGGRRSKDLKKWADSAVENAAVVADSLERSRRTLAAKEKEIRELEASMEEQQRRTESSHQDIENLFGIFQSKLGLRITRSAPSVVQIAFTVADETGRNCECSFKLGLEDPKSYCVSDCSPELPPVMLNSLLEKLNSNPTDPSALPAFACGMRHGFKRAIQRTGVLGGC